MIVLGVVLNLIATVVMSLSLMPAPTKRYVEFEKWCTYYQKEMGLTDNITFVVQPHPDYCAWVTHSITPEGFMPEDRVFVGISFPDDECAQYKPRMLALHEMCHLRMKHPEIRNTATFGKTEKEAEVRTCMEWYARRRR